MKKLLPGLLVALLAWAAPSSRAQEMLYSQNFDSMGPAGTTVPAGWTAGYLGTVSTVNRAVMSPYAGNGLSITPMPVVVSSGSALPSPDVGTVLNLGTAGNSDRALGNYPRTTPSGDQIMQVAITNNLGRDLTEITLSYAGEQWRQSQGTSTSGLEKLRVLVSTTSSISGFTYLPDFDFTAPKQTTADAPVGGLDGNDPANRAVITGTITLSTPLPSGGVLYVRWHDWNDNGTSDDFLAIDDVQITTPRPKDLSFQEGVNGYAGTQDTYLRAGAPDTTYGTAATVNVDQNDSGQVHGLLRFDNLFGPAINQIPPGALIRSASLTVYISNASVAGQSTAIYRMLAPWSQVDATWNSLVAGVSADGVEAAATADWVAGLPVTATGPLVIPLSVNTLQAWSGGASNYGWAIFSTGSDDGIDFYSSESGAANNRPKLTVQWDFAGQPSVKAFKGTAVGFTMTVEDGNPPGDVNVSSIVTTFNGAQVTAQASKVGTTTTITYTTPAPLAAGSTNLVSVALTHSGSKSQTIEQSYVVGPYQLLPASLAVSGVDTSKPGFRIWPYQTDVTTNPNGLQPNSLAWTEDQLLGLHGPNVADLFFADASGSYSNTTVINYSIEDPGTQRGNFNNDKPFPGIPGLFGQTGDSTMEILTFLNFPAAGAYQIGVNSDDGFKVTAGKNPRDRLALVLGQFDGGRGAADTLFDVVVEQPGFYPFRLLWENGDGELPGNGANCEWFTVAADGTKILINDTTKAAAIRAYREGPLSPYVKWLNPLPDAVGVPLTNTIDFLLADGSASAVQSGSIGLWFNGLSVLPAINRPPGTNVTTVKYDPPGDLAPEETNTIRLVFGDNATPAYSATNDFSFVTAATVTPLVAIDATTLWRYEQSGTDLGTAWKEKGYNDSTWLQGAALLGNEGTINTGDTLRTQMTMGSQITYYFRIHFNWSGPAGVRLRLRHVLDDGAVFYLNGAEVHRFGLAAGATFNASTAFTSHENAYEGPFLIPTASLVQGDNVLAAELHQNATDSSDIVFGAVLEALTSRLARTTVESVTPAPNAVGVARDATIALNLVDGTQKVQPGTVRLWVNDGEVNPAVNKPTGGTVTAVSYSPGTSVPYGSTVRVKLVYSDDGPAPSGTTYEWSYTTTDEVLFAIDATTLWSYEVTGQDLGTAWKEKGYNDSAWPKGAALIADETGATAAPIRTVFARGGFITFYFRTHFNWTGSLAGINLRLRHVIDDGAVCYLNGVEVHRTDNMPTGPVNYLTVALVDHENAWQGPYDISTTNLVVGTNVFAVEVHQNAASSSDLVFGAELTAILPKATPPTRLTATRQGGNVVIEWTGSGTLQSANDVPGTWSDVSGATSPYPVPVTGARKFFRLKM